MLSGRAISRRSLPLWAFAALACGGEDLVLPQGDEPQIRMMEGDDQVAPPGSPLPEPLSVRLVDPAGAGIPGRTVVWVVSAGGGTIQPASPTTDANGFAFASWTLGPAPGPNTLRAEVPDIGSVTFTATGSDDGGGGEVGEPSASQSTVRADPPSIAVGTGTSTIVVTVRDAEGDPVAGATVTLEASGSGNTLTQPAAPTGPDGTTSGTLQSSTAETKEISATVNGSLRLDQTVQVSVAPALEDLVDHLVYTVQPPEEVQENETFSLQVALVDAGGNVVPLSGIFIYLGLFEDGDETPTNDLLSGERFDNTENGLATFDVRVSKNGRYRIRALTDDLPRYGQGGPEPWLFSRLFEVD